MKTKSLVLIALVLSLLMVLGACTQPVAKPNDGPANETPNVDAIKNAGKIIMLTNAAFPPFEYLADDNSIAGVDVDIAGEIAKDLGVELEIVDMDFDGIILGVQSGKGDFGAAGMTVTEDRKKSVNFTIEYATSAQYILVAADETEIKSSADLAGKVIGVQQGTTGDFYATDDVDTDDDNVRRYKDAVTASLDLAAGRIDAVITDELPAKSIANANDKVKLIDEVLTEESYAIAIAKEKTDLLDAVNATIERLMAEGKISAFINTHMGIE